jgi:hypothetical protein
MMRFEGSGARTLEVTAKLEQSSSEKEARWKKEGSKRAKGRHGA